LVPPKYYAGTFLKIKIFCRDYFSIKWVQSSCSTFANHHKSGARDQNQNETYLKGPKTTKKKLQGLKPKRNILGGTKTIF